MACEPDGSIGNLEEPPEVQQDTEKNWRPPRTVIAMKRPVYLNESMPTSALFLKNPTDQGVCYSCTF